MKALSSVTDYTADGLLPSPVDLSHFGRGPAEVVHVLDEAQGQDVHERQARVRDPDPEQ